jgi:charged multivesicular body protein 2A
MEETYEMVSQAYDYFFPKPPTVKQVMRENRRGIQRAIRDLEKEKRTFEEQERVLTANLRKIAKDGVDAREALVPLAKGLVRMRNAVKHAAQMHMQLQAVDLRLQTLTCTYTMGMALKGATKAMKAANMSVGVNDIMKIVRDFERSTSQSEEMAKIMDETIDESFSAAGEEEVESDELVNQVLDEIGCTVASDMISLPVPLAPKNHAGGGNGGDAMRILSDDLESRLQSLKH